MYWRLTGDRRINRNKSNKTIVSDESFVVVIVLTNEETYGAKTSVIGEKEKNLIKEISGCVVYGVWIDQWQSNVKVEENLENGVHLIGLRALEN